MYASSNTLARHGVEEKKRRTRERERKRERERERERGGGERPRIRAIMKNPPDGPSEGDVVVHSGKSGYRVISRGIPP